MKFIEFCKYLEEIEATSSRNDISQIFADLFEQLDKEEVKKAMYLTLGRLVPKYIGLEFNMSVKMILKSFTESNKYLNETLLKKYRQFGDIGQAIYETKKHVVSHEDSLELSEVYDHLYKIANLQGKGSASQKIHDFEKLLKQLSSIEAKFASRIVVGNMRLGLSEKTILDSLSIFLANDKRYRDLIQRAFGVRSDIGVIAEIIKTSNSDLLFQNLGQLKITPGVPVASKLVEREKNTEKIFERMPISIVQPKLDGLRGQIHYKKIMNSKTETLNVEVEIFSRNMERMTHMYPDIINYLKDLEIKGIDSFVLDSELIGFDYKNGLYLKFQETIQRKRKYGVSQKAEDIPLKVMAFDLLYLNEEDITQESLEFRIKSLQELCDSIEKNSEGRVIIQMLETKKMINQDELLSYFEENIAKGLEGIIVKKIGTNYEPGTRNFDWIKLKASSKKSMVDTIDGVVLGYYRGEGARSQIGIGAILVGIYDEIKDRYYTIAKVGTGITDDLFVTMKNDLMGITQNSKPEKFVIDNSLLPDFFVQPKIVVEVEADEITKSKIHTACMDEQGKGLSMRFPRLKIWNRKDKNPDQTTSQKELLKMYEIG